MIQVICAIISVIGSVLVACVGYKITKATAENEKRAERRKKESMLSLEMISASIELTEVCANALTGGHNNGNVEAAKKKVYEAKEKYRMFHDEVVAEETV